VSNARATRERRASGAVITSEKYLKGGNVEQYKAVLALGFPRRLLLTVSFNQVLTDKAKVSERRETVTRETVSLQN